MPELQPIELELHRDQEGGKTLTRNRSGPAKVSGGGGKEGGGSPFDMSDLLWMVVRVPWALREGMLEWVSYRGTPQTSGRLHSQQALLPARSARSARSSCSFALWAAAGLVGILDLRTGWKGLLTSEDKSPR